MNTFQEYRNPILIAAGALVVAIVLYAFVISPQSSKLSTLQTRETTLQTQQATLQGQLTVLQTEKQKLPANCADLQKISTQIPSVESPSDLAAEQSSFYDQLTTLVGQSGTSIPTFSWTGNSAAATTTPTTAPTGASGSTAGGVVPVPVSMTITGSYGQMSTFVGGLDSFPRLFVIQTFTLSYGATAGSSTPAASPSAPAASESAPPLWTGGKATPAGAGPYSLNLTGSIYYTTTANALAACNKATAAK